MAWFVGGVIAFQVLLILVLLFLPIKERVRLKIFVKVEGRWIMATPISVVDTHAPLQLRADYVNAKGKIVPAPAGAQPINWVLSDPALASQVPVGATDVVTLLGPDGAFTVAASDGTFSDSLAVTVTPDQAPTGISIAVANP